MTEGDDILSRFFSSKSKYVKDDKTQKSVKGIFTRCRMTVKNINKNTSTKILQSERRIGFKSPGKFTDILIRALRICKRATVESQKGLNCRATVPLLQARLGPFRPVSDLQYVSVKFKRLIIKVLEMSPKSLICVQVGCPLRISQAEKPKVGK